MNLSPPAEAEVQFYYLGFYKALKRYRAATLLGWFIVAAGVASVPLGWRFGHPHGTIDLALAAITVGAGIALVYQSVTFLDAYVGVPFPHLEQGNAAGQMPEVLKEIVELMRDVETGGWQEAYAAIPKLRELGEKFGLQKLD